MRHVITKLACGAILGALLGGCYFHDHSKDTASAKCIHVTGSMLCQNEQDAKDTLAPIDTPAVQSHQNMPHE
ncbi:MAG: hypothetical protein WDN04_27955 [Rhodospirillales bacterium]